MVRAWMGKGSMMPWAARASTSGAETPSPAKVVVIGVVRSAHERPVRFQEGISHCTPCARRLGTAGAVPGFSTLSVPARPVRAPWQHRRMRVLVVEDEASIADALAIGLRAEGFDVDIADNGTDGLWRARETAYAAIILDILLPGMNGFKVCRTLRDEGVWTPILMLTAKDGELDEAEALDTGADDFLSKPFSFVVLVARLRALLRRGSTPRPTVLTVGSLTLDPASRAVPPRRHDRRPHRAGVRAARAPHAPLRRDRVEVRAARRGMGPRLRGRPEHRRGLHRLRPQEDRRAVRRADDPHRARRRLPPRSRTPDPADDAGRWPDGVARSSWGTVRLRDDGGRDLRSSRSP